MSAYATNSHIQILRAWPTGQHEEVRARIARHRLADEIIQGSGWRGGRGCAIGCSLDNYSHEEYARVLGIPPEVAHLVDCIHEGLPEDLSLDWPGRVAHALQPGADTTHVWSRFVIKLFRESHINEVVDLLANLYARRIMCNEPTAEEWAEVANRARNAKATATKEKEWKIESIMRAVERAADLALKVSPYGYTNVIGVAENMETWVPATRQAEILIEILTSI